MLVLGSQVLLGFQFRSFFEPAFVKLPPSSQYLKAAALGLMLVAVGLLLAPGAYHRIVERGEDTHALHRFTTGLMDYALLPFAAALGLDVYVSFGRVLGAGASAAAGVGACVLALVLWYALTLKRKAEREPLVREAQEMSKKEDVEKGGAKL